MRLTMFEITAIQNNAKNIFGDTVKVYLFGSRVDDDKKGGDIDYILCLKIMIICLRKKSSS